MDSIPPHCLGFTNLSDLSKMLTIINTCSRKSRKLQAFISLKIIPYYTLFLYYIQDLKLELNTSPLIKHSTQEAPFLYRTHLLLDKGQRLLSVDLDILLVVLGVVAVGTIRVLGVAV